MIRRRERPAATSIHSHHRAMCAWIGALAAHREGLIGRLLRVHESVPLLLDRSPHDLATALTRSRAAAAPNAKDPEGVADSVPAPGRAVPATAAALLASDAFHSVLCLSPEELLAAVEQRGRGHTVVTWCDDLYPPHLRHLADPPLCLFLRHECGEDELKRRMRALATRPVVAVVGTRAPSPYGEEMAALLGRDLATAGVLVISGLAMGIDALAHAAAAEVNLGRSTPTTVAILGCGPDIVCPKANSSLRGAISRHGLLVSEFPWGTPARPWRFPARNRLMAALAQAVVLVEGARRSGARLTAGFALELGREVLAVPGEAGRRLSAAPHSLLRQGASLCESAIDVLNVLPVHPEARPLTPQLRQPGGASCSANNDGQRLLDALRDGPLTIDQMGRREGISSSAAAAAASELEVDGLVRRLPGGAYRLLPRE